MPSNYTHESFLQLVKLLVHEFFVEQSKNDRNNNYNNKNSRKYLVSKQKLVYDTIFSHHIENTCDDKNRSSAAIKLNDLEKITWHTHVLRKRRCYDEANTLEELMDDLKKKDQINLNSDVRNVLCFLSLLIDKGPKTSTESLSTISPWVVSHKEKTKGILPNGPLNFDDTRLSTASARFHYTHFPSRLFEPRVSIDHSDSSLWQTPLIHACHQEPGTASRFSFFQSDVQESCLGALVGPKKSPMTPDTALSIPDLPSVPDGYSIVPTFLTADAASISDQMDPRSICSPSTIFRGTPDEGYGSSQISYKSSREADIEDIWDEILNGDPLPQRHRWESLGQPVAIKNNPFLSEAGDLVTHKLWLMSEDLMCCFKSPSDLVDVPTNLICQDLLHLLMGLPSSSFQYYKKNFAARVGLCYKGVTPETFHNWVQDFVNYGNSVKRIEDWCNSGSGKGLVFKSFILSLKNFLYVHRSHIHSFLGEHHPLRLKLKTESIRSKVVFVDHVCFNAFKNLNGLNLIGNLKAQLMITQESSNYLVLLSLLQSATQPLFRFMERWIYEGVLYDPTNEFMIRADTEVLNLRDRTYWVAGYKMLDLSSKEVPEFLRQILTKAFLIGKSLNLLKICAPKKYFFSHDVISYPAMRLCITLEQTTQVEMECKSYTNHMRDRTKMVTLAQKKAIEESQQQLLIETIARKRVERKEAIEKSKAEQSAKQMEMKREAMKEREADIERSIQQKQDAKLEEASLERKVLEQQIQMEQEHFNREGILRETAKSNYFCQMKELSERELTAKRTLNLVSPREDHDVASNLLSPSSTDGSKGDSECDRFSQMSLSSDFPETPLTESLPEILNDNEQSKTRILSPEDTDEFKIKNKILIPEYNTGSDISIDKNCNTEDANVNIDKLMDEVNGNPPTRTKQRPHSQLIDSPELSHFSNTMKKSKSDFFPCNSNKAKALHSSLFDVNEGGPVLIDQIGGEILKHRGRNVHGHISDSVIQNILWKTTPDWSIAVKTSQPIANYRDQELLSARRLSPNSRLHKEDYGKSVGSSFFTFPNTREDITQQESKAPTHLSYEPILIVKALSAHIQEQAALVNDSLVSFFLTEQPLLDHLDAIKSLILLHDPTYAITLATNLFHKARIHSVVSPQGFNVAELNCSLTEAIAASCLSKSPFADNLYFLLPSHTNLQYDPLNALEMRYRVDWPLNIVLDDAISDSLVVIWRFLIKLHYVVWCMDDIFKEQAALGCDSSIPKLKVSPQFHRVSLFRHEMHQFTRVVIGYISYQGIEGGWMKLQMKLKTSVFTLEDLHSVLREFIETVILRCFLTPNCTIIRNILNSILDKIILFRKLVLSQSWKASDDSMHFEHPNFDKLENLYQDFSQHVLLFNKLLTKMFGVIRAKYIEDLVCQLNFNENFTR